MKRHLALLLLAGMLAWLGAACGGGGGGGGPTAPPTPPPPPPPPVSFNAAGTPGSMTIHMAKADGTPDNVLRLEIRASQMTALFGLGFDLVYPTNLLDYRGGSQLEGGFLSADGSRIELLAKQVTDGTVVVGLSRFGDVGAVEGSGLLMSLDFTVVSNGSGDFSFSANNAFDAAGKRLDETVWQGGSVDINL